MQCHGDKETFAIEYEIGRYGLFRCWIKGDDICRYMFREQEIECHCDVSSIKDWFGKNLNHILFEEFPLEISASTSSDFYDKSGEYDSENLDEFDTWFTIRQNWFFRHSWYSCRKNEYIPNVYFRRKANYIEINWNSLNLYHDVRFFYPFGVYYMEKNIFNGIIMEFINS